MIQCLMSCRKKDINECSVSGAKLGRATNTEIGVAVDWGSQVSEPSYSQLVDNQFTSITAENIFKPAFLHPAENSFYWDDADSLISIAETNNQRIHGHTLIWHNQLPSWISSFSGSDSEWMLMMKSHIKTIVNHMKGRVTGWDVLNEAFEDDGSFRETVWKTNIGQKYIERAFEFAHEADPEAKLFYNEYGLFTNKKKRRAVLLFLKGLKDKGIPVHGIGLQTHISICDPSEREIRQTIQDFADAGFLIHLSEVDISINPKDKDDFKKTDELFEKQGRKMSELINAYLSIPENQRYGITFWGLSDKNSWIPGFFNREDYPLLFDSGYNPKPMYCVVSGRL